MRAVPLDWQPENGWSPLPDDFVPALILYFGSRDLLANSEIYQQLRLAYPGACILGCSTGGQIARGQISDSSVNAVAVEFNATQVRSVGLAVSRPGESRLRGAEIGRALSAEDLVCVFVLSDGLNVNGSELVAGIRSQIGRIPIMGGLAGDDARFEKTLVSLNAPPQPCIIAAVGFYGDALRVGHGSTGGWDVFGPMRRITRSQSNVLLELDGRAAFSLYERYLSEEDLNALPSSALLFPLQIFDPAQPDHRVVRTVLRVDRQAKSMTFAGDVPQGWIAQLMRGRLDGLTAGAANAARDARCGLGDYQDREGLAILVSCIGRRLLMGQRTVDEVDAAEQALGPGLLPLGFYSYGEISPHSTSGICELHNQTMTITALTEAA